MAHLEDRVEQEAGLRAAMDRELGDISAKLGAQQRSLNALAEVQGDHTRRLTRIADKLGNVEKDVSTLKGDVSVLKGDMVTVKAGVHAILDLLDANLGGAGN